MTGDDSRISTRHPRPVDLTRFAWLSIAAALLTIALKGTAWLLTDSVGLLSDAAESTVNLVAAVVALVAAVTWIAWPTPAPTPIATRDLTITAPGGPGVDEPVQLDSTIATFSSSNLSKTPFATRLMSWLCQFWLMTVCHSM